MTMLNRQASDMVVMSNSEIFRKVFNVFGKMKGHLSILVPDGEVPMKILETEC